MPLHQLANNVFFNLFDLFNSWMGKSRINFQPVLNKLLGSFGIVVARNKHNFELSSVKVVTYDNLMTIALKSSLGFGYQKVLVGF